jgi:hypothetical protein
MFTSSNRGCPTSKELFLIRRKERKDRHARENISLQIFFLLPSCALCFFRLCALCIRLLISEGDLKKANFDFGQRPGYNFLWPKKL